MYGLYRNPSGGGVSCPNIPNILVAKIAKGKYG
jgi:hypothetical protein